MSYSFFNHKEHKVLHKAHNVQDPLKYLSEGEDQRRYFEHSLAPRDKGL